MPVPLRDILQSYSEQDLEKIARDKIDDFEHLRLPKSVLIEELNNHITSPSYVYDSIAFRPPPCYEMLKQLIDNKGYESPISGFRKTVLDNTKEIILESENGSFLRKGPDYSLYLKILQSAWESNESIDRSEAKLLESLRQELVITFKEHCILEHHPKINQYWNNGNPFQRERNHLLQAGIIHIQEENDMYVLPEDIAYRVLSIWEVELDDHDYSRLLDLMTKEHLSSVLDHYSLHVSGSKEELCSRIIENHIPPSKALDVLHKDDIAELCKKADCKSSGLKEEVINRLIDHIRSDSDILTDTGTDEPEEIIEEEKELQEKDFKKLFNLFTTNELQFLLSQVPTLVTYGIKEDKIDRLWTGPYSEWTLLELLNKRELKEACSELGLMISGRKDDLINRIMSYFKKKEEADKGIDDELRETTSDTIVKEEKNDPDPQEEHEIPQLSKVKESFPFLDSDQQIILSSLIEFKSLNEQDIDRIVARYNLGWLFYKPEMDELDSLLNENGYKLIEQHSFGESDRYDLRYEQNIFE